MAVSVTQPKRSDAVPITTDSIVLPFETGPISEIMKSAPTQSVTVDIGNSAIQEVLPSDEVELGVIAPNKKSIERIVGQVFGGRGFLYELRERRDLEGYFDLWITSLIGPLHVEPIARRLQSMSDRVSFYVKGNLVAAL